nr:MAG TPA: hypothetical protein [Caudoviricetes sp.]
MGWTAQISSLEELEALMCGNILPREKYPQAYYRMRRSPARRLITYATEITALRGTA